MKIYAAVAATLAGTSLAACGSGNAALAGNGSPAAASPASRAPAAEPGMTVFICKGTANATLLQWQDSNGYLSGSYEYSNIGGQAPQEQVSSDHGGLSGTLNGNAISLSIGLQQPLYGTLDGSQLTLNVPQSDGSFQAGTCNSGSLSDWNSAVSALDSQASGDNSTAFQQQAQASSAAAQQQHEQQVSNAQSSLSSDVGTLRSDSSSLNSNTQLASDINTMKNDYAKEQTDYQTEVTQGSCSDGSLGSDAATVSSDSATVDSDLASEQSDVTSIQDSLNGIQTDISNVNNDLSTLQGLGASPGTDSSGALAAGNKAISNANSAVQWANGHGNSIDGQAHQLATTAQNNETQHGC
jgi:hypothetical protein